MLHLSSVTDSGWPHRALEHLDEILLEHAHLEKKAAGAALRLLFRYPTEVSLQLPLSELAREELEHFEIMLRQLERRGVAFGPQQASPYAAELLAAVRGAEPDRLLDSLLCSSLIEARSCERMQMLGGALVGVDDELAAVYSDLVACEARHHGLYVRLAKGLFAAEAVETRLQELAAHEAEVVGRLPPVARLHT